MFNVIITLLVVLTWYVLVPKLMFVTYRLVTNPSYFKMSIFNEVIKNELHLRIMKELDLIINRFFRIFQFLYLPLIIGIVHIKALKEIMNNEDIKDLEMKSKISSNKLVLQLKYNDAQATIEQFKSSTF